jgi:NADPH:quinone reductase
MRAIVCTRYGEPEALELLEMPTPAPGPDELLIRVRASAVGFHDALIIQGVHQTRHAVPFIPGSEVVGVVDAVGDRVTGFAPGDRVAAQTRASGGFAEFAVADAVTAVILPHEIPFDFAAAFFVTYGTSYLGLVQQGRLKAGETVLVLGAAGGVGLAAVEIANALGARVIAAASTPEKLAVAQDSGADACVDYTRDDLKTAVRALTDGRGADVVFDPVGGKFAEPALRALAWEGRYLVVGFAAGDIPRIPLNLLLLKNASAVGVLLGEWAKKNPQQHAENALAIFNMYAHGRIKGRISHRFSLAETPAALRWMMDRKATGKLVIEIP